VIVISWALLIAATVQNTSDRPTAFLGLAIINCKAPSFTVARARGNRTRWGTEVGLAWPEISPRSGQQISAISSTMWSRSSCTTSG
jgi:hypothetical protein